MNFCGMRTIGNKELLKQKKVAFFASRHVHSKTLIDTLNWASSIQSDQCIIGPFHSRLEREILRIALERGANVIWLLGRQLPEELSKTESQALQEKRLLIISCFNREHHNLATARYCCHLAMHHAKVTIFASIKSSFMLTWLQKRCKHLRKKVIRI